MSSLREQILADVNTALNTGRPPGVPAADRSRADDIPETVATAISVRPFRERVERVGSAKGPLAQRQLVIAVDCWASAAGDQPVDQALDPLLEWVTKALGGQTLAGKAHSVEEAEIRWDMARRDGAYVRVPVLVAVRYQTLRNDATARV